MKAKLLIMFIALFALAGNNGVNAQTKKKKSQPVPAEAVDLGLPSGTKWAPYNVGATKPEEFGDFYAWGETKTKNPLRYTKEDYRYYKNRKEYVNIGDDISRTEYDVAHVKWEGNWCMPTKDDVKELLDNCKFLWTKVNGVIGGMFTSKINGNYIFLPAAGGPWYEEHRYVGEIGKYWLSAQDPDDNFNAYSLVFGSNRTFWGGGYDRGAGQCVRPVFKK